MIHRCFESPSGCEATRLTRTGGGCRPTGRPRSIAARDLPLGTDGDIVSGATGWGSTLESPRVTPPTYR
ncbi:hypothetical protein C478_16672 [Natrinema thermotolerans DSM 11552]|nr:hypothetical protein C478_16672 [Natrinema thermotolerans DSM 11552]